MSETMKGPSRKDRARLGWAVLVSATALIAAAAPVAAEAGGTIRTLAGTGVFGFSGDGGPARSAALNGPFGLDAGSSGDVYIADSGNHRIRRVAVATDVIETIAGSDREGFAGDGGSATNAMLNNPMEVAVTLSGDVFIADTGNHRIRKVDGSTGLITTVAGNGTVGFSGDGGPATSAALDYPYGVTVDTAGNVFIADTWNGRIRRVDADTGVIDTVAGAGGYGFNGDDGPATAAVMAEPWGIEVDGAGNLFIADSGNHRIRRVDAASGIIETIAGSEATPVHGTLAEAEGAAGSVALIGLLDPLIGDGGPARDAILHFPRRLALDGLGGFYIADTLHSRIRWVSPDGFIHTVAGRGGWAYSGDDGPAEEAGINRPYGIAAALGTFVIADTSNSRVRSVS